MNKPFNFKQFTINQDQCAMKVGTDGVLLGAWTNIEFHPFSVLDIGAGTGLLSLMLAQRSSAQIIDALEIDDDAYEQCVENFEASPWGDRLFCYHAGLDEFVDEIEDKYDLIISNPPFYAENVTSGNKQRDIARSNFSLPFEELIEGVSKLLSETGKFSVIIPFKEEKKLIAIALAHKLYPNRITQVKGSCTSEIKRSLIEFSFSKTENLNPTGLVIEKERHSYTKDYIHLTKDFYLKM
ncbi:tRNA1(Val) (adenine(37)-N6)-methyltransferase [Abyssalbus ytuae]|uniref:tRNA1(Val) (adenine(37)-N6)-methyltransferase n=1 Tax=Abyssalbus ytuae TaxID=2926907 RepID=A0A9E6ZYB3_9FLAO|nr:methyltransferase [Abyssalbus ytuae]UOB16131.1 methyltransferase [Abyssalbus ytuae]